MVFAVKRKSSPPPKMGAGKLSDDFPPKPKWKPNLPIDLQKTIETFAYYSDRKKIFAVFKSNDGPDTRKPIQYERAEIGSQGYAR